MCFLWTVLPCLFYVHEHDRLCFPMSTKETAVFDCICWPSSSRNRKGQSYPVEYCLESMEGYSECTIHKGEPEPRKGNVNTVFFFSQNAIFICRTNNHTTYNTNIILTFTLHCTTHTYTIYPAIITTHIILSTLFIRPGQILESVARSLFTVKACDCKWFNTYICASCLE